MIAVEVAVAVIGVILLGRSGSVFVGAASRLALRLGMSSVVVGVVVIGFGTSAPELVVSGLAAVEGSADVGMGNVVGSNLANLTLVLGIAAIAAPLRVSSSLLQREGPLMIGSMVLFGLLAQRGLTRWEGVALLTALISFAVVLLRAARADRALRAPPDTADTHDGDASVGDPSDASDNSSDGGLVDLLGELDQLASQQLDNDTPDTPDTPDTTNAAGAVGRDVVIVMIGLVGTLGGAQLLVWAATGLADRAGLSGGLVGFTLVAVGTSLPEIATTLEAARRGDSDMIIGTLFGSNVINSLAAGAAVGLIAPSAAVDPTVIGAGVVIMLVSSLTAGALMRRGFVLTRREGALLIAGYVVAITLLA